MLRMGTLLPPMHQANAVAPLQWEPQATGNAPFHFQDPYVLEMQVSLLPAGYRGHLEYDVPIPWPCARPQNWGAIGRGVSAAAELATSGVCQVSYREQLVMRTPIFSLN